MHTPANGSPVFSRTRRMSPTLAASVFVREKRWLRAPVGSRMDIWSSVKALMGSLHTFANETGGGTTLSFLLTRMELALYMCEAIGTQGCYVPCLVGA